MTLAQRGKLGAYKTPELCIAYTIGVHKNPSRRIVLKRCSQSWMTDCGPCFIQQTMAQVSIVRVIWPDSIIAEMCCENPYKKAKSQNLKFLKV